MNQIIALLITNAEGNTSPFHKAKNVLERLAKVNNYDCYSETIGEWKVMLIGRQPSAVVNRVGLGVTFCLCPNSSIDETWDRYLRVSIGQDSLQFSNDYAGTIPVYYTTDKIQAFSNVMSCIEQITEVGMDSISPENLYGFLRFSHFIWEETVFKNIHQIPPDSKVIWDSRNKEIHIGSKNSLIADESRFGFSDKQIADDLFELNQRIVLRTLSSYERIILPLSAGYDSRMIFSVLASNPIMKEKLSCFTYGDPGCIEVEAAKALCRIEKVCWENVLLPCKFLDRNYLDEIYDIFGSSLHMHGMYQLEFSNELTRRNAIADNTALTSGFMTGVPAGQHNRLLNINSNTAPLVNAMNAFGQSKLWTKEELEKMPIFGGKSFEDSAEIRFRSAFDKAPGKTYHKSILFDVWTRQRNFISYYPRTFEWRLPTVSPHMNVEYANFFLSLEQRHLNDRKAVELLFQHHYSKHASIISNSNGTKAITGRAQALMYKISRKLRKYNIERILPSKYWGYGLNIDQTAIQKAGLNGLYPLNDGCPVVEELKRMLGGKGYIDSLMSAASIGDVRSMDKLVGIQSIAFALKRNMNG